MKRYVIDGNLPAVGAFGQGRVKRAATVSSSLAQSRKTLADHIKTAFPLPTTSNITTTAALENRQMNWNGIAAGPRRRLALTLILVLAGETLALAQTGSPIVITPDEIKWTSQGAYAAPGMEQVNLVGDPAKPGPYTIRLKFPKGYKVGAHTHPDAREVTILSGVFATGYGDKFDEAKLKVLPAGSFYTEPANLPHYIEIKEDVILQVTGIGPSSRRFVDEARK
jgi:quercetin dioxygenase-like cupin family protein